MLKAYAGKDIALEYAKVEAEMKAKHVAEWKEKKGKKPSGGLSFGSMIGLSGVRPVPSFHLLTSDFRPPLLVVYIAPEGPASTNVS